MAKKRRLQFNVTGPARRDLAAILNRSLQEFGMDASLRYRALLRQALLDIEADPERPGSQERPEIMVEGAARVSALVEPEQCERPKGEGATAFSALSTPRRWRGRSGPCSGR